MNLSTYAVVFILIVFLALGTANAGEKIGHDFERLLELIQIDDQKQPLYVFNDFAKILMRPAIRQRGSILKNIPVWFSGLKINFEGGKLRWKLGKRKHRLLFAPEKRTEYAALYKEYTGTLEKRSRS